jgi:hypothetical protein
MVLAVYVRRNNYGSSPVTPVMPVGCFTGAIRKSLLWGVPLELFCMAKMSRRYFRATGMIFPRLPLLYACMLVYGGIILQNLEVNKML